LGSTFFRKLFDFSFDYSHNIGSPKKSIKRLNSCRRSLPEPRFAGISRGGITIDFNSKKNVFQEISIFKSMIDTKTLVLGKLGRVLMKTGYDFNGIIRDESIVVSHGFGDLIGKTHWVRADLMIWLSLKSILILIFLAYF